MLCRGKEVQPDDRRYRHDPAHCLVASRVVEAATERPCLAQVGVLDSGSVMAKAGRPVPRRHAAVAAIDVSPLDADLVPTVVRLVRLLDAPDDARVLSPLIQREIVYRLLVSTLR